jgi:hypothetical protein
MTIWAEYVARIGGHNFNPNKEGKETEQKSREEKEGEGKSLKMTYGGRNMLGQ